MLSRLSPAGAGPARPSAGARVRNRISIADVGPGVSGLVCDGEAIVVRVPAARHRAPVRHRPAGVLGPLVAAGFALAALVSVAAPAANHLAAPAVNQVEALTPPPPPTAGASVLPRAVELSATGPYVGPDVAARQQDFAVPGLTGAQNMSAGLLDPATMLAGGFAFEFAKATQGTSFTDDYFAQNRQRAQQAGLLFGAYHFLEAGDGAAQADAFHQRLEDTGGVAGVMLMVDVEWRDEAETTGPSYADVQAFCARLHQLVPDRQIVLYTLSRYWGKAGTSGALGDPPAPEGTVLNWASYLNGTAPLTDLARKVAAPGTTGDPYPRNTIGTWDTYTFRQFTSTATYGPYRNQRLPDPRTGQSTLDADISFAGRNELLALAGLTPGDAALPDSPNNTPAGP